MLRVLSISLAIFISVTPISLVFGDNVDKELMKKDYYTHVYDYTTISFGKINICVRHIFNDKIPKGCELDFTSNQMDNVIKIINTLNQITYVETQSNPEIAFEYGGNCQAISLLAHTYLNKANIKNELVIEKDHMYNTISLDNKIYKLDITNSIFKEINNEKFRKD